MRRFYLMASVLGVASVLTVVPAANASPARIRAEHPGNVGASNVGASTAVSAVSDGNGDRFVFWRQDQVLTYAEFNRRSWSVHSVRRMGRLFSAPSASFDRQKQALYVFWVGPLPHLNLFEAYLTNRWHGPFDLGMGPLGSQPSAPPTWFDGIREAVAWEGTHRQLRYATSSNPVSKRSWRGPFTDRSIKSMASPPSVVDNGGGSVIVFYTGANGHLRSASLLAGSLTFGPCDLGFGSLGSNPEAVFLPILQTSPPRAPTAKRRHFTGSCPKGSIEYYGLPGEDIVAWESKTVGLKYMQWADLNGTVVVQAPETYPPSAKTSLGSAPSLAAWPVTIGIPPPGVNDVYAYWESPPLADDLFQTNLSKQGRPKNLHIALNGG